MEDQSSRRFYEIKGGSRGGQGEELGDGQAYCLDCGDGFTVCA